MRRAKVLAAVIYGLLVIAAMTFIHYPDLQAQPARAKIAADQAREVALSAVPGTIKQSDLETEHGRLIYSFEIERPGQRGITEVNVSAQDGTIVDVHYERPARNQGSKVQESDNISIGSDEDLL